MVKKLQVLLNDKYLFIIIQLGNYAEFRQHVFVVFYALIDLC